MENEKRQTALTCSEENRYTVQKGDTMTSIARQYGVSAADLIALNPYVSPNVLVVGQVICVPERAEPQVEESAPQEAQTQPEAAESEAEATRLTEGDCAGPCCALCPEGWTRAAIQAGESYADLLVRYDISYRAMRIANPRLLPGLLIPGQSFCVPPESDRRSACPAGSRAYTLTPGETFVAVAQKFRMSEGRLLRLNPDLAPSEFVPGATVCVGQAEPAGGAGAGQAYPSAID